MCEAQGERRPMGEDVRGSALCRRAAMCELCLWPMPLRRRVPELGLK